MNFKFFIFDWDGTVMDSAGKIVNCMQKAALLSDLPVPTAKQVEHIIGISLIPAIMQLFKIDKPKAEIVAQHYKKVFVDQDQSPCPLFEGAITTLSSLSEQARLAVATGKARRGLERAWEMSESKHFFDTSRCADEAESKPSSDMLLQIIEEWKVKPHEVLMIGDTVYDMQMAENINMPRVAVSYGVHDVSALQAHKPLAVIDKLAELLKYA